MAGDISKLVGEEDPKEPSPLETVASPPESVASEEPKPSNTEPVATVVDSPAPNSSDAAAKAKEIADAITDKLLEGITDIGAKLNLKQLWYSDPGGTKSSRLGTADNQLILDFEDGLISMKTSPMGMKKNIKAIKYKSFFQANQLVDRLAEGHPAFDWVEVFSLDSISDLHKRMMQEHLEAAHAKRPSKNLYVPDNDDGDYVEVNELMIRFIRRLRDLDRNIILTSHARTVEPKNKPAKTFPDFSESLANKVEAFMDIVGYIQWETIEGKNVPVMRVISDGTIHAKNRFGLPEKLVDPTYDQLYAACEKVSQNNS